MNDKYLMHIMKTNEKQVKLEFLPVISQHLLETHKSNEVVPFNN